jgi:hypothetical protein
MKKSINRNTSFLFKKRGVIETIIELLKKKYQIEHTRHQKPENAFVCFISGLLAYQFKQKKPAVKITLLNTKRKALY